MKLLSEPITIRNHCIKNRIVLPPMAVGKTKDSIVNDDVIQWYDHLAESHAIGTAISEHMCVSPEGSGGSSHLALYDDKYIDGVSRIADTMHRNGCVAIAQLDHMGGKAQPDTGYILLGPSDVIPPSHRRKITIHPKPMTSEEINNLVISFTNAAVRAEKAGFDGIQLHAAHGYLLNEFYSPVTNHRTDAYTCNTLAGRCRLIEDVIQAIRSSVDDDFIISVRFGAVDYMPHGSTIQEAPEAAIRFAAAGADVIDVSGGLCGTNVPGRHEKILFRNESECIHKAVSVPVTLTGGISTPAEAESLLENKQTDLTGIGRAMIQDPYWALKALQA